jgi:hypothetical protein
VVAQINRDQAIRGLLDMMKAIFDVMSAEDKLKNMTDSRRRTVELIFQQTTECAWFIRDYVSRNYSEIFICQYA